MKREPSFLVVLLSAILITTQAGCAGKHPANASFKPDYYSVRMKDGTRYKVEGSDVFRKNDEIVIRSQDGAFESRYPINEVEELKAVGAKQGSHALAGLGIGAATGLGTGLAIGLTGSCTGDSSESDSGDCAGLRAVVTTVTSLGGAVLGGLIGLGVGSAVPKRKKVILTPTFLRDETQTQAGIGFSTSF